jgi:hypothetical protein
MIPAAAASLPTTDNEFSQVGALTAVYLALLKVWCSVADPGSGALLTPGSGTGKKSVSGSGMNIPDHIS